MFCPACNHRFSFLESCRVLNPWKIRCPQCGAILSGGRQATWVAVLAGFLGLLIASVAITMEELQRWATLDSLVWLAVAVPLIVVPYEYCCWKWVRLEEKRAAD
jgi:hypothetical protein